jgi:hypothetical protein
MTDLYNIEHYAVMQLQEIEEHRWYMGEQLNRPIKDYELIHDWIKSGHAERFKGAYLDHLESIETSLETFGGGNITPSLVHKLLED